MADFTTVENRNSLGWIIGIIVVVLVLLYAFFGGQLAQTTGDNPAQSDSSSAVQTAPAAVEPAATASPTPTE